MDEDLRDELAALRDTKQQVEIKTVSISIQQAEEVLSKIYEFNIEIE